MAIPAQQPKEGAKMNEMNVRKSLSEQIARASSNKTSQHANSNESAGRKSLSERIAHANAARVDGAWARRATYRSRTQDPVPGLRHILRARRGAARDHGANLDRTAESRRIPRANQPASGGASGQPLRQSVYPGREPRVRLRLGNPQQQGRRASQVVGRAIRQGP